MYFFDEAGVASYEIDAVEVTAAIGDIPPRRLKVTPVSPTHQSAYGASLPRPGEWTIRVHRAPRRHEARICSESESQMIRRILAAVALSAAIVVVSATPAAAHSVAGVGATNYRTTLQSAPKLAGLRVHVIEIGSRFEAALLRAGRRHRPRLPGRAVPAHRQPGRVREPALPRHLHQPKPRRRNSAGQRRRQRRTGLAKGLWRAGRTLARPSCPFHGQRQSACGRAPRPTSATSSCRTGRSRSATRAPPTTPLATWCGCPAPSPAPFIAAMIGAGVLVLLAARRSPYLVLGVVGAILIAVDLVHTFGIGLANAGTGTERVAKMFSTGVVSLPAWLVGIAGIWFLRRRRVDGFFALVFAGLIVAVVGGVADVSALSQSQVPFAFGIGLVRWLVAASLALGLATAAASALAIRRLDPIGSRPGDEESQVSATSGLSQTDPASRSADPG